MDKIKKESETTPRFFFLRTENINFIVAISAVLISAASFYATYLQADAANKQVKAMTFPIIFATSGNYDIKKEQAAINIAIKNAGTGPAFIKSIDYHYKGSTYHNNHSFLSACCNAEYKALKKKSTDINQTGVISSSVVNNVLAGQTSTNLLSLIKHENNRSLWEKLNKERFNLSLSICYCSLLDNCYQTTKNDNYSPVEQCPLANKIN